LISGSITRSPYRPKNQGAWRDSRESEDQGDRDDEEDGKPEVGLDEDRGERQRGTQIGDEGRAHQQLPDADLGQASLDEDGVDDGQRGRRKRGSRDQRGLRSPTEQEIGDGGGGNERPCERDDADPDRGLEPATHVGGSTSIPARKVKTIEANLAMKSSHSWLCRSKAFPKTTPSVNSSKATVMPSSTENRLATRITAARTAAR
jgi:hypothetical protein